jgi:hypothetical protein
MNPGLQGSRASGIQGSKVPGYLDPTDSGPKDKGFQDSRVPMFEDQGSKGSKAWRFKGPGSQDTGSRTPGIQSSRVQGPPEFAQGLNTDNLLLHRPKNFATTVVDDIDLTYKERYI